MTGKGYSENGKNLKRKYYTKSMASGNRLIREFFIRDVLDVAPELIGKVLVVKLNEYSVNNLKITEVEAYRGAEDKACHACKGRTSRTEIMYHEGGRLYIYLVYGIHWMMNVVTGMESNPQAILIRGVENCYGPGRVTRKLGIDRSFYGEDLTTSKRIWIEDSGIVPGIKTGLRIGISYAGEYWKTRPWRFYL
jgi:DNA-3-methyladenine glycosylase